MSEATIVALVIICGVFIVMSLTIHKHGAEAAMKMWGVMGALTGVAFGAITSYYFTNKTTQQEIAQVKAEKETVEVALQSAAAYAVDANEAIKPLVLAVQGGPSSDLRTPKLVSYLATELPNNERALLAARVENASSKLKELTTLAEATKLEPKQKVAPKPKAPLEYKERTSPLDEMK